MGEISVIIATASPHRKDALQATEMAIDELKKAVPIWKKVSFFYKDSIRPVSRCKFAAASFCDSLLSLHGLMALY